MYHVELYWLESQVNRVDEMDGKSEYKLMFTGKTYIKTWQKIGPKN